MWMCNFEAIYCGWSYLELKFQNSIFYFGALLFSWILLDAYVFDGMRVISFLFDLL